MPKVSYSRVAEAPAGIDPDWVYSARQEGRLSKEGPSFKLIDLFAGAGGLTVGFTHFSGHTFQPVWANDFNQYAANTYNQNFGNHCVVGDILKILSNSSIKVPKADVVIGGPPCQGFSLLNKKRENDPRKQMWRPFLEVVKRSEAQIFVMENVPQLLGSPEHMQIIRAAKELGFKLVWNKLCAADYGAPQTRHRAFIVGCRFRDPAGFFPPKKTHYNPDTDQEAELFNPEGRYLSTAQPWRNVRDAIGDLPKPIGVEIRNTPSPLDLHFGRTPTPTSLKRYKSIPKEGMNRFDLQRNAPEITPKCWKRKKKGGTDLFGRLWWNRPAFTIRTEFYKPEKGRYLHPLQHRPITHREAARFQCFPDSFRFTGSKIEVAKQIGNAVPTLLAARVADCVYALLLAQKAPYGRYLQP
jgi:DNA (cytosine-5)-methyltransferase 1